MDPTHLLIAFCVMMMSSAVVMGIRSRMAHKELIASVASMSGSSASIPDIRELEMSRSFQERVFRPLLQRLYGLGNALTPKKNIRKLSEDLNRAGMGDRWQVADFLGLRFLCGIAVGIAVLLSTLASNPVSSSLAFATAGFALGLYVPNFWLKGRVRKRQKAIMRGLPDALDLMSICVDAGLGFEAAIQKVSQETEGPLSQELSRIISEIRVGVPRVEALRHMAERTGVADISNFVAVLIQADSLGITIRDVLHTQSEQMRIRRHQRAEEAARKAPLKMLFPLVFFIMPALFAVIFGPAIPRIMTAF